jgi:RNA polymerase sigma factor (sigma-70 family)
MGAVHPGEDVLARARAGDQQAFAELVEAHRRVLWAVCLRITNNQHDAEDALQECLIAAWHHLDQFRGDARVGTWLYRVAANAAIGVARRRNRPVPLEDVHAVTPDVGDRVADVDRVRSALAEVPLAFRSALVLREICDLTYEQIAEHEDINIQTVKSRISRARAHLRELLAQDLAP